MAGSISAKVVLPVPYVPHKQMAFLSEGNRSLPLTMLSSVDLEVGSLIVKSAKDDGGKGLFRLLICFSAGC